MIEFRATKDPQLRSVSGLDKDGRFELSSRSGEAKHPGAQPGSYQVTVFPSGPKFIEPIVLPNSVTVAPQVNELTITIDASNL